MGQELGDQCMPRLVVRDDFLLAVVNKAAFPFGAGDGAIDALLQVVHVDFRLASAGGQQRRFVDDVGQIGADKSGRSLEL